MNSDNILQLQAISNVFQHVLLTDPLRAQINQLKNDALVQKWPLLNHSAKEQEGLQLLNEFFNSWQGSEDEEICLHIDFTKLLCGIGTPLSPPWGSAYLLESGQLNGPSTQELQLFYNKNNINVSYKTNEPIDHLGLILSVVSHLLGVIAQQENHRYQEKVLTELLEIHLLPFSERVFQLMESRAETAYYKGFACLGQVYLQSLASHFNIIPTQKKLYR